MGFVEDQQDNGRYYYCTKNVRFLKEDVLTIIYGCFENLKKTALNFEDVYSCLQKTLHINNVNRFGLKTLLEIPQNQQIVKIQNVIDAYNKYSDKKLDKNVVVDISHTTELKPKKETPKATTTQYYYCTKTTCFPLIDVISAIYELYKEKDANSLFFNDIYNYLREKFNVNSFNRQNLYKLLHSYGQIPFSNVNTLYINNYMDNKKKEEIYNLDLIKNLFITNANILHNIIKVLGTEFLITIAENGLLPMADYLNAMLLHFNQEAQCFEFNNRNKHKLFDKNNAKIFIELLKTLNDDEWLEVLSNENQVKEYVAMFIEDKEIEQKKLMLRKSILFLYDNIDEDNKEARIKYLMPATLSSLLENQQIVKISDIANISNKTAISCYEYRDILINTLKKLQQSLPMYLNERFKYLLQMVNKDYRPNSLWENYVSILENRADDLTLEKAGKI